MWFTTPGLVWVAPTHVYLRVNRGYLQEKKMAYHAGDNRTTREPVPIRLLIPDSILDNHDRGPTFIDGRAKLGYHFVLVDGLIGAYDVVKGSGRIGRRFNHWAILADVYCITRWKPHHYADGHGSARESRC